MRAVVCSSWGGPEVLSIGELPEPECRPSQVLIRPHAWGINYADLVLMSGSYHLKPAFPFAPGMEVAGEVVQVGAAISHFKPGDRVAAIVDHGGLADLVGADETGVFRLPPGMDYPEGASFLVPYSTAYLGLVHRGQLRAGESLLVLGAAGGVGLAAVVLGSRLNAAVIAVASTPEKRDLARRFGATSCIDSSADRLREQVKDHTRGRGADVIYDPVGGASLDPLVRCLAFEGRLVVIGFAGGQIPQVSAGLILAKGCSVLGSSLTFTQQHRPAVLRVARDKLSGWHAQGRLPSLVTQVLPFEQAPRALAQLAGRAAAGRIVLQRMGKAEKDV